MTVQQIWPMVEDYGVGKCSSQHLFKYLSLVHPELTNKRAISNWLRPCKDNFPPLSYNSFWFGDDLCQPIITVAVKYYVHKSHGNVFSEELIILK
jgi:hypothetical protein